MENKKFMEQYGNRSFANVTSADVDKINGYVILDPWGDVMDVVNCVNYPVYEGGFDYLLLCEDRNTSIRVLCYKYHYSILKKQGVNIRKICRASKVFKCTGVCLQKHVTVALADVM